MTGSLVCYWFWFSHALLPNHSISFFFLSFEFWFIGQRAYIESLVANNATIKEGKRLRIVCKVQGHPPPKVVWRKDNRSIAKNRSRYQFIHLRWESIFIRLFMFISLHLPIGFFSIRQLHWIAVTWKSSIFFLSNYHFLLNRRRRSELIIKSVFVNDSGQYECRAKNKLARQPIRKFTRIDVLPKAQEYTSKLNFYLHFIHSYTKLCNWILFNLWINEY